MSFLEWFGLAEKHEKSVDGLEKRLQQLAETQTRLQQSLDEIKELVTPTTTNVFKDYKAIDYNEVHPHDADDAPKH